MNALKSVICQVNPEDETPITEKTETPVDVFLSGLSFLGRMTGSILKNGWGNRLLVNAKKVWKEMYEED